MTDVNLIPARRLAAKRVKARVCRWLVICGTYLAALALAAVAASIFRPGRNSDLPGQLAAVTGQIEQENKSMLELRRALAEVTGALETKRAFREQPDWSMLLAGLARQLGEDLVLTRCRLKAFKEDSGAPVQGGSPPAAPKSLRASLVEQRYQMTLSGFGRTQESVSQFALGLEGIGLFDRVRLVNSSRQTFCSSQAVGFTVECRL
jgi:hypothetical protein